MSSDLDSMLKFARSFQNLTAVEERELHRRIQAGDPAARQRLVEHNMRLAFKLASSWHGSGLDREDLVQEAMTGLMKAVDKFDPDKGRFTTYATRWIKKQLWDAAYGQSNAIKRPSRLSRTATAVRDYTREHPTSTLEEIAIAIDRPLPEVREALDNGHVVASTSDDAFREIAREEVEETFELLDVLEPIEREAVAWKYGLYGDPCSYEEVAARLSDEQTEWDVKTTTRLCRNAVKKLRAARQTDNDVICEES